MGCPSACHFAAAFPSLLLTLIQLAAWTVVAARPANAAESASTPAPSSEWVVRSWQTEDGLPQNSANAIVQTRDGFLWVGTSGGLARFDGVRFRKFGLEDGLRSVRISTLVEDRQGALWIGTSGGGLSRWANGRITSFGAEEGFPTGTDVICLAADRDGSLWIGTEKGLVHATGGTFQMIGEAQGLPRKQVRAITQDAQGTLWVSVPLEGLFRRTNGQFVRMEKTNPAPGDIYCLLADRDGSLWAGAGSGVLWQWRDGMWKRFDPADGLPKANIEALAQGSDGALWVGGRSGGLFRASGERFVRASDDAELAAARVNAVTIDREGSIWAGSPASGLFRLSPRVLGYWSADAGLPPVTVTSVAEDESGSLWVSTTDKGLHRFDGARFTKLEDSAVSGEFPYFYCTVATSDGSVWGAGEQCLYRFQPGQPTRAFLDAPIRGEAIRALCADGDAVWIGTYYAALLKADADGVKTIAPPGTFPGGITSIVREAADTLWIATSEGLHRWERGQVKTWNTRDGLLTAYVRTLFRDADGTLWLGTLGGGLARFKDGRFVHITTRHGLVDDVISQIAADDFGFLWLGSNRGLMRLDRRELDAFAEGKTSEVHPVVFARNEGMLNEQCSGGHSPTVLKTKDGRVFFPTANGLAEIDPRRLQTLATNAPQAGIEGIRVDDQTHALDAPLVIPPGHHRVAVSFTAPVLRGGEWVRFRYRLEGRDKGWVAAGQDRLASYDGLRPGRYIFRVAAADGNGAWHEAPTSFAFTVQPFFWETLWFRIVATLLAVGLIGGAVWWRVHLRHQRQLAEVERERQHQAEVAHAGRLTLLGELSASLAHELKQPLAAILSNAQAGLRFLDDDAPDLGEVRAILGDVAESDRRASEIITRLRSMMKKDETQMEPRDINADIGQVLGLLRSDLVTRQVSVVTKLASDLPPVNGDHIQLQQVLLNLIVNGCDAMTDNAPEERRLVIETVRNGAGTIAISVADCGTGIAPERLERIFEPLYSTKDHGLGMGLSICRTIIHAHGGQLRASNNADRGATFHFTLTPGEEKRS